jgi:VWFA-related protein
MSRAHGLLSVAGLVAVSAVLTAGPQSTFRTRAELVRVDVLVTEGGQPILGLAPDDFELLDEGVAQKIELASLEKLSVDLVLALDVSESVQGERLSRLIEASLRMLDRLEAGDQVSLLTFNHGLSLRTTWTRERGPARAVIQAMVGSGLTALRDAAHAGLVVAGSGNGRPLLVLFSDGRDTASWLDDEEVLRTARRMGVVAYAVTVGGKPDSFLGNLVHAMGGNVFEAATNRDLEATFAKVLQEFKSRYLVGFTPQGVPGEGWHQLAVRVKGRRCDVKARAGYYRSAADDARDDLNTRRSDR